MVFSAHKRCALYIRVSTSQQVNGNSLSTQKTQLIQYAKNRDFSVADIYMDAGLTGKNTNRPEFQRLLADASQNKFDIVLVWAVDRISRSLTDLIRLVKKLAEHSVDFISISQDFDTSDPAGMLTLHLLGSFAQFERELLVERTKEGHLMRLRKSDWSCGVVSFGYRKEDGKLIETPEEAKTVRLIFELFLKLKSLRGVTNHLNGEKIKTRRGKCWETSVVRGILMNPVHTGANVYGRHTKNDTRLKHRDKWTIVVGTRKPLIQSEKFEAVQKILREKSTGTKKSKPQKFPLSGSLICGKCGSPMCGKTNRRGRKVHRYYKCIGNLHKGRAYCVGTAWRADTLEKLVVDQNGKNKQLVESNANKNKTADVSALTKRHDLNQLHARTKQKLSRLFELYEANCLEKNLFIKKLGHLRSEADQLVNKLNTLKVNEPNTMGQIISNNNQKTMRQRFVVFAEIIKPVS